jgi:DNA polymerase-3 subunit alpha
MFVHLRLHSAVFRGRWDQPRIDDAVQVAADDKQPALALTDLNNLFGHYQVLQTSRSKGVKPLLGAEIYLESLTQDANHLSKMILLVQSQQGYLNLCELLSRGWTPKRPQSGGRDQVGLAQELSQGLIALSGAQSGPVGQALVQGDLSRASELALQIASIFPHRFYIELQRAGRTDDEAHVVAAVQLASNLNLPVVATHPVQFTKPDDYEAHEARVYF